MNEWKCDYPGCGAVAVARNSDELRDKHGWCCNPFVPDGYVIRCSRHLPSSGPLDEGELLMLERIANELGGAYEHMPVSLQRKTIARLCAMARTALVDMDEKPAPYAEPADRRSDAQLRNAATTDAAGPIPHVVTAEAFAALAARVAKLEGRNAHMQTALIEPAVEFNERCKELGARVRSRLLCAASTVPPPYEATAMARALLSRLEHSRCLRVPTVDDCIVAVMGSGWPAEIIQAIARWLGHANEGELEDSLAAHVLAAVERLADQKDAATVPPTDTP